MERMAGRTSLWWDMESCPLPSSFHPYIVSSMAPSLLRKFNITGVHAGGGSGCSQNHFSAFQLFSDTQTELDQTLINCGIELQQLRPGQTCNEMEKIMMADVLVWAMNTPPPANIIFIVGSVDFCYVFQKLRQRSYNVFLVCQSMSEMHGEMLGGVNDCLEWLPLLWSLKNEDQQLYFPGGISVYDHTFSTTALPTSSTSIHSKEIEESSNAFSFSYNLDNLFSMKPSPSDGWNSGCNFPLTHSDEWDSAFNSPPIDSTSNFPSDETAGDPVQPEPRFSGHFTGAKKPRRPVSSASSTEKKKKPASLEEFKAWLNLVVRRKKHAEEGYNISPIHAHFEKATGKILDEKLLGFSKIINLVENECKDIAVVKEGRNGCHLAFPVKANEQKKTKGPKRNRVPKEFKANEQKKTEGPRRNRVPKEFKANEQKKTEGPRRNRVPKEPKVTVD